MTDPFATPSGTPAEEPARDSAATPPVYGAPPPYGTPPGQPPYGAPVYGAPLGGQQGQGRNGFGVTSLVLGILSIVSLIGGLLGIPGLVFGILGRKRAKRGEATNGGVALSGVITSVIGLVLLALYVTVAVLVLTSSSGHRFFNCLDAAGSNDAATQQCSDQFARDLGVDPHRGR